VMVKQEMIVLNLPRGCEGVVGVAGIASVCWRKRRRKSNCWSSDESQVLRGLRGRWCLSSFPSAFDKPPLVVSVLRATR
jgi:hypothetical protein